MMIFKKKYDINQDLANAARITIQQILDKVKMESELKQIPQYYTAFVVMMYTVSTSILKQLNSEQMSALIKDDAAANVKNKR